MVKGFPSPARDRRRNRLPYRYARPAPPESALRSDFYSDQRSARPPVDGTVARGQLHEDAYFYTGKLGNNPGDVMPFPVTKEFSNAAANAITFSAPPATRASENGNGFIPSRGFARKPPSFSHSCACRKRPSDISTTSSPKASASCPTTPRRIPPPGSLRDIVAYVRALQLSQNATKADVPDQTNNTVRPSALPRARIKARALPVVAPQAHSTSEDEKHEQPEKPEQSEKKEEPK